jgi:hypothetical protein
MATVATITDYKLPTDSGEDSYNILDALRGKKLISPIREAIIHHSINGMFAIRQGRWKLVIGKGSGGWSKPRAGDLPDAPAGQLYDMSQDIGERKNLYNENPEIVRRLTKLLNKYKEEGRSTPL